MPTTAYLAGADSNDVEMLYAAEATWGTPLSGSGDYTKFRVNGESLSESRTETRPPELRADGQAAAGVTQDEQARGGVTFGISYGNMDWAYAGLVNGAWTADLAISSGNIAANNGTSKFEGAAGDFDDVVADQWIEVAGFSTAGANGFYYVTAVAADGSDITVTPAPATDAGGTDETITISGSMLRNATSVTTYTIQKRFSSTLGFAYAGALAISGQINAQRGQFFSGAIDFLVKSEAKAATILGTNPVAAPVNKVMNTVGHFQTPTVDGVAVTTKIMGLNTSLVREGANMAFGLGSAAGLGVGSKGTLTISGTMNAYFASFDEYDAYKAETERRTSYRVTDAAGNTYIVTIPVQVLGSPRILASGPNQAVMAEFPWRADPSGSYSFQLDRFAA